MTYAAQDAADGDAELLASCRQPLVDGAHDVARCVAAVAGGGVGLHAEGVAEEVGRVAHLGVADSLSGGVLTELVGHSVHAFVVTPATHASA